MLISLLCRFAGGCPEESSSSSPAASLTFPSTAGPTPAPSAPSSNPAAPAESPPYRGTPPESPTGATPSGDDSPDLDYSPPAPALNLYSPVYAVPGATADEIINNIPVTGRDGEPTSRGNAIAQINAPEFNPTTGGYD